MRIRLDVNRFEHCIFHLIYFSFFEFFACWCCWSCRYSSLYIYQNLFYVYYGQTVCVFRYFLMDEVGDIRKMLLHNDISLEKQYEILLACISIYGCGYGKTSKSRTLFLLHIFIYIG